MLVDNDVVYISTGRLPRAKSKEVSRKIPVTKVRIRMEFDPWQLYCDIAITPTTAGRPVHEFSNRPL